MAETTGEAVGHLLDQANAAYSQFDLAAAQPLYEQVLRLDPGQALAHSRLGAILAQQGHLDAAEQRLRRALELAPNMAAAVSNLGNVHFTRAQYAEALDLYRQAAVLEPENPVFQQNLHAAYKKLGHLDKAVDAIKKARRLEQAQHRTEARAQWQRARRQVGCGGTALMLIGVLGLIAVVLR